MVYKDSENNIQTYIGNFSWDKSKLIPAFHMDLCVPPVIPEHSTKNNLWAQLGFTLK